MIHSKNRFYNGARYKSSSLIALNELDKIEKMHDWRKNYVIKPKEIGRGHFSKVYQVTCKTLEKIFAAKVIRRKKGGIDRLDKIRKEAEIIKKLNDKNVLSVIQLYETHENFSEVVLICEYAKGGSLFHLIQEFTNGLNQSYVKCVIYKILKALECMHLDNFVHLDIKADNILLRELYPSTNIAICDFGLATELKKGMNYKELVGTPDYMAPEIINYERITFKADMWSVGVLLYYLLTGVSPFMGQTKDETLMNVSKAQISFDLIFDEPDYFNAKDFISSLCVKGPNLRLSSSVSQSHKWFDDIPHMNLEYPLGDTCESTTSNFFDYDMDSKSNDNLNNYDIRSMDIKRSQSVDLQPFNMNSNFPLENTQLQSFMASSGEIFIDDEEALNRTQNDGLVVNNNAPINKWKPFKKLLNVDEVPDETSYDFNGNYTRRKSYIDEKEKDLCDHSQFNSNSEIIKCEIENQANNINSLLLIQSANLLPESQEIIQLNFKNSVSDKSISSHVEKNVIKFNNVENSNHTNCENNQNSQLKLSQIEKGLPPDSQQLVKSDLLINSDSENKLSVNDPIDEYENISDNCGNKCNLTTREFQTNVSTNSDYDEDDDFRYTSLLAHFRIFELCNLL